jgi:lipoprotein-releasing system permease protein
VSEIALSLLPHVVVGALCVALAIRGRRALKAVDQPRHALALSLVTSLSVIVFVALAALSPLLAEHLPRRAMQAIYAIPLITITGALLRVRRHEGKARALWSWAGVAFGVAFIVLSLSAARLPEQRGFVFKLEQEIVRFAALGVGVLFLLVVLSTALPLMLDALERRSFTSFVGARHVRATKSGFLTVISFLSMAGVGVSSCALCSVTSIMGGFGADLKRKILGNNAHIVVDVANPGGFPNWEEKLEAVRGSIRPLGGAATPVVAGDAMGSSASNTAGTLVRGIDPDSIGDVIDLEKNIEVGRFEYLTDTEALANLPPDEIIGLGPRGDPFYKGPDLYRDDDLDLDPEIAKFLKSKRKVHPGIIIGKELAKSLHVYVGDEVTLLSPIGDLGPMGPLPRSRKFRVAAIFYSGMYEYDASHAYILLDVAQKFFSLENRITHIDVRTPEPEAVTQFTPEVAAAVAPWMAEPPSNGPPSNGPEGGDTDSGGGAVAEEDEVGAGNPVGPLRVRDWKEMNKNLFSALKLEKLATFIILSIAIAVASFCIVCTLLLMVTEKGKEIAILKALGASDGSVMVIFMLEGIIIGGIGTIFGVATALASMTGLSWFGVRLDPDVYYIDRLPVNVNAEDYLTVALAAFVICTLATIYPARAASKLSPVDGLRYE